VWAGYTFFFIFSFSFPLRLLEMEGGHIWVVCLSREAWNREGVFYILLWLRVPFYYTFYRVFGGRDEKGLMREWRGWLFM